MAVPVDKSKAGTIWVDSEGARYVEERRVEGLTGLDEVELRREEWPHMPPGWFNAGDIETLGLREEPRS